MLILLPFIAVFYLAWIATTLVVAVDLARRFRSRTIYLALILLFLVLGFTWNSNSIDLIVQFFGLSCLILPAVRLLLHFFAKDKGYEIPRGIYQIFVFGVTAILLLALVVSMLSLFWSVFWGSW